MRLTSVFFCRCGVFIYAAVLSALAAPDVSFATPPTALEAIRAAIPSRAALQLEVLGASLDGESVVRAVATGHRPVIDLFLASRANVNLADSAGRTALLVAAMGNDWELVKRLLAAGADPKTADARGRTPLMAAAMYGEDAAFQEFLKLGADPTCADADGHTALHYAIVARKQKIVARLLDTPSSLSAPCCDEHGALGHAFETRDWAIVAPLLERHGGDLPWTPQAQRWLADALKRRDGAKVRLLLEKHAAAPTPEGSSQPFLAHAVADNDLPLFQLLLECGADPNTPVNSPVDPEFLEKIPAITVRHYLADEPGMTTLMLAAGLGRPEFVKPLLEKGASRTAFTRSKHKLVPIYFAAWAKSPECLQLLIDNAPPPDKLRVEISLSEQRARLFKNGISILSTDVSTGRPGFSTPEGQFVVTDKHQSHISSIYKVKMPFFMRLNCRDFGLHEGHVPNHPASHGCIRVPADAARKFFREVPIGTLVTIAR